MSEKFPDTYTFIQDAKEFLYSKYGYAEEILNKVIRECGYDNIEITYIKYTADKIFELLVDTQGKSTKFIDDNGIEYTMSAVAEDDDFMEPEFIDICVVNNKEKCTTIMTENRFYETYRDTIFTKPYPGYF